MSVFHTTSVYWVHMYHEIVEPYLAEVFEGHTFAELDQGATVGFLTPPRGPFLSLGRVGLKLAFASSWALRRECVGSPERLRSERELVECLVFSARPPGYMLLTRFRFRVLENDYYILKFKVRARQCAMVIGPTRSNGRFFLVVQKFFAGEIATSALNLISSRGSDCCVCYGTNSEETPCEHPVCVQCFRVLASNSGGATVNCPMCRRAIPFLSSESAG